MLSIVDNRTFKRLIFEVLEHDPTHGDIERFLVRFKGELDRRGLSLLGVTTDGSPLYPQPLATIFRKRPAEWGPSPARFSPGLARRLIEGA